jgi:Ca2+-binding EF-hand superfamily protein
MYQGFYLISDISGQNYTFYDHIMADLSSPDRHITAKDMECLKEAFALFDRDRDGEINTEELRKVMRFSNSSYS